MTDFSELLDEGRVRLGQFSRQQVQDCLRIARRDLEAAEAVVEHSPDWAFNIAYNAMHQAGRALMFHLGYRAVGEGHHATVVRFLKQALGTEHEDDLALMDRMRRKRNLATYDAAGTISPREAREAAIAARKFVKVIAKLVSPPRR